MQCHKWKSLLGCEKKLIMQFASPTCTLQENSRDRFNATNSDFNYTSSLGVLYESPICTFYVLSLNHRPGMIAILVIT